MRRIFIFMSRWIWINHATSAWYISIFLTISILIAGFASRLDDNVYTSLEVLNTTDAVFPYRSKPSRSNPNVMFRRQPPILYWIRGHKNNMAAIVKTTDLVNVLKIAPKKTNHVSCQCTATPGSHLHWEKQNNMAAILPWTRVFFDDIDAPYRKKRNNMAQKWRRLNALCRNKLGNRSIMCNKKLV